MSYNISSRIYIRSLERAARASVPVKSAYIGGASTRLVSSVKPAIKTEGLAVAAAAQPSDSNLPAPGATPGVGHFQKSEVSGQKSGLRPLASDL